MLSSMLLSLRSSVLHLVFKLKRSEQKDIIFATFNRFVRFVSTPEILERVYTIETQIIQLEEAIAIQSSNDIGHSTVITIHLNNCSIRLLRSTGIIVLYLTKHHFNGVFPLMFSWHWQVEYHQRKPLGSFEGTTYIPFVYFDVKCTNGTICICIQYTNSSFKHTFLIQ